MLRECKSENHRRKRAFQDKSNKPNTTAEECRGAQESMVTVTRCPVLQQQFSIVRMRKCPGFLALVKNVLKAVHFPVKCNVSEYNFKKYE